MSLHQAWNNFTGGEVTPYLDARIDLQKYMTSCLTMENFHPLTWGGARSRTGTLLVASTKIAGKKCRLLSFNFNTETSYTIEMGDFYLRFYKDGAQIMSGGSPYELASVYAVADVFAVQFKEINDVLYLVHPNYPVQKLSRLSDTNWTMAAVSWTYPALRDQNINTALKIGLSALTGSVTMTASSALFDPLHVGAYFELQHIRSASGVKLDISASAGSASSTSLAVKGDWTVTTANYWRGTLIVERSTDGGTTWETVRLFQATSDRNINGSGTETKSVLLRMTFTSGGNPFGSDIWTGGHPSQYVLALATLEATDAYIEGLVKITGYTSSTVVTATVINSPAYTAATDLWSEGAWSNFRGYPQAVGFFEQRIVYAGTTSAPNTVWGSVIADFENFQYGDADDAAVAYQIADTEQNPVVWLSSLLRIHAGTTGGEFIVASGNTDEPMTPSNVTVRRQSSYGCQAVPALPIDNGILFIQRQGRRIREMREMSIYANPADFVAPDLTLLAEHITESGIVQMDYARLPDPLIYCVRADGQLAVMTYNREQNITAWARYVTDGFIESIAVTYGSPADVVYLVVRRTINGTDVRYVEVFTASTDDKVNDCHLDCAYAHTYGSPTTAITGLTWLENRTVSAVVDGTVFANLTVSNTGTLTLPKAGLVVRIGLPYTGTIQTMKMDAQLANGTSQGRRKQISNVCIRFRNTLGCTFKVDGAPDEVIPFADMSDPMDSSPPLFTGDKVINWPGGPDLQASITVTQPNPYPCTILGLFPQLNYFGD